MILINHDLEWIISSRLARQLIFLLFIIPIAITLPHGLATGTPASITISQRDSNHSPKQRKQIR